MWKDYLSFSRQEQKGFLFLTIFISILILYRLVSPFFLSSDNIVVVKADSVFIAAFPLKSSIEQPCITDNISVFNPNKVSFSFLIELGIDEQVAYNWVNYLSKGGFFTLPKDVGKVYGLNSNTLEQLIPYMVISKENTNSAISYRLINDSKQSNYFIDLNKVNEEELNSLGWSNSMIDSLKLWLNDFWVQQKFNTSILRNWNMDTLYVLKGNLAPKKVNTKNDLSFVLDMNSADTAEWMLLNGIGSVLSKRIVAYRKKLGGFITPDQLLEVYGISPVLVDEIRSFLRVDTIKVLTMDINRASIRQLRNHPYLDFYKAQALVEERKQRGVFTSVENLLELPIFNDGDWPKIRPYLYVK